VDHRKKQVILRVENLEDRTLLSSSFPLDPVNWTALGPAPVVAGSDFSTGRIAALAAHPTDANTIYVATAGGGVWKTVDGGVNWANLTDNQETLFMGAIALAPSNPDIVYAGTGEANWGPSKLALHRENIYSGRGILKSTDGGANWTQLGRDEFYRRTISRIVVDPKDADTVYVAVGAQAVNGLPGNTGVWKSTDGGKSWTQTLQGIDDFDGQDPVSDLVVDPGDSQHLYAAVGNPNNALANGVYQTFDGGATWTAAGNFPTGALDPHLGRITLAIAPGSAQTLFAAIANSGINAVLLRMMKSTDGGNTWFTLNSVPNYMGSYGDYNTSLAVDPADPNVVYAGGQVDMIRTANGGTSWAHILGSHVHPDFHAAGFDANGKYLSGSDGGIWRLNNPVSLQWQDLNGTLSTIQLAGIALNPDDPNIAYAGAQDNYTEKFTGSLAWTALRGGDGGFTRVDWANPRTVYMTYQYSQGSGFLARSDNSGSNPNPRTNGIDFRHPGNFYAPYIIDPANSNRLILGTSSVYESTNRADTWTAISAPLQRGWTVDNVIDSVAAAGSDANTVYAGAGGRIFVTHDHGQNWTETIPGLPDPAIRFTDIHVDPNDAQIAFTVAANYGDLTGGGHVWVTVDGGADWQDISGNLPDEPVWSIAVSPSNTLYVGAEDGVYVSNDFGTSWDRFGGGLPNVQVRQLELNPNLGILAAATFGRGMWELDVSGGSSPGTFPGLRLTDLDQALQKLFPDEPGRVQGRISQNRDENSFRMDWGMTGEQTPGTGIPPETSPAYSSVVHQGNRVLSIGWIDGISEDGVL
jgi:photosystem II stability/assembly factor-like uncharacterized protein